MAKIKFDVEGVESSTDLDTPIPKGLYKMKIEEIEETTSKKDDRPMLKITLAVVSNKNKDLNGRKVWDYIKHEDDSSAWKLKNFLEAVGLVKDGKATGTLDTNKETGKVILVKVKHESSEEYGTSAKVGSMSPLPSGQEPEDEGEAEEPAEEPESGGEESSDEDYTAEDIDEMDKDELKSAIAEYEDVKIRVTAKSKVEDIRAKFKDALDLGGSEEAPEVPEDWDELSALDRDEAEALINEYDDIEVDADEYDDDRELLEAIAEELEIEIPEEASEEPEDYFSWKVEDLKAACKERGLKDKGSKKALANRLKKDDAEKAAGGDPF